MKTNLNALKTIMGRLTKEDAEAMEREMYPLDDLKKEATRSIRKDKWNVKDKSSKPGQPTSSRQRTSVKNKP